LCFREGAPDSLQRSSDFENHDSYTNRMEVSLGKIVGDAKQISLSVALEFPLDDKTDQYSGKLGITYFFD
jgi:hypothetical protein